MTVESDIWTFDFDAEALKAKYIAERDKRQRKEYDGQYIVIGEGKGAKYADWLTDPWVPLTPREPKEIATKVTILGGGFSGIQMGHRLKNQYGITDFIIIDKAGDFGGTWYWNRYPGAACDSEAWCYMPMLEEFNYMPSHRYAPGPEILQYCWHMAREAGIYDNALFQTGGIDFSWDDDARLWRGTTDRGDKIASQFLVTAGGPLNSPHLPDIEGIDTFEGKAFHTSRWEYNYTGGDPLKLDYNMKNLNDKTVAIVGTGATAIQAIPYLAESAKKLIVFQRTPSAIDVRDNHPTDPARWKSQKPGWQERRDVNFQLGFIGGDPEEPVGDGFSNSWGAIFSLMKRQMKYGEGKQYSVPELLQLADYKHMERIRKRVDDVVKDKRKAELLKPWYNLLCKRPVYSDTYLQTFNRDNVELVDTSVTKGIERITCKGVVVAGQEYPCDVLIWSTGFIITAGEPHNTYTIRGRGGLTWHETMEKKGGYSTMYGMVTNGFPNYFIISIPQAAASVNFPSTYNYEGHWIVHVISEAIKRGAQTVEVTREAEEEWVKELLSKSVANYQFSQECTPGYYNVEGDIERMKAKHRLQFYGAGPLAYRKILDDYKAKGTLDGFEVK